MPEPWDTILMVVVIGLTVAISGFAVRPRWLAALCLGAGALTLVYFRRKDGRRGAESFVFGGDGLVTQSMACYAS